MTWRWLVFNGGIINHAIDQTIYDDVIEDLKKKHKKLLKKSFDEYLDKMHCEDSVEDYRIDYGGICKFENPEFEIELSGRKKLFVFKQHAEHLYEHIMRLAKNDAEKVRVTSDGRKWLKLKGYWHCCCIPYEDSFTIIKFLKEQGDLSKLVYDYDNELYQNFKDKKNLYVEKPKKTREKKTEAIN